MLLSRSTFTAGKAASPSELHTASAALPCIRQPHQFTSLSRFVAAPALQEAARRGTIFVPRSYASEAHDAPPLGLKEALKSELEFEHDNHEPEAVSGAQTADLSRVQTLCLMGICRHNCRKHASREH